MSGDSLFIGKIDALLEQRVEDRANNEFIDILFDNWDDKECETIIRKLYVRAEKSHYARQAIHNIIASLFYYLVGEGCIDIELNDLADEDSDPVKYSKMEVDGSSYSFSADNSLYMEIIAKE